jgi:hypothetical protein
MSMSMVSSDEPMLQALNAAHGELRDAYGAVKNLEHLLRSVRVGPRALADVIPDVEAACSPLGRASAAFFTAAEAHMGPGTTKDLAEYFQARVEILGRELGKVKPPLNASRRLKLEQATSQTVTDLDGALYLIDLLHSVVSLPAATIDIVDLIEQHRSNLPTNNSGGQRVSVQIVANCPALELRINPRTASLLLGLCASYVSGRSGKSCRAELRLSESEKQIVLELDTNPQPGSNWTVFVQPWVGAGKSVAQAVARAVGAELSLEKNPHRAALVWATGKAP